jgi:hypothetical protein
VHPALYYSERGGVHSIHSFFAGSGCGFGGGSVFEGGTEDRGTGRVRGNRCMSDVSGKRGCE